MRFDRWAVLLVAVGVLDVVLTARLALGEMDGLRQGLGWSEPVVTGLAGAVTGVVLIAGVALGGRRMDRSSRELHRRAEELEATARTTGDWLWECDTAGVLTYSSPAVEALLGYSSAELVGRHSLELVVDDNARELMTARFGGDGTSTPAPEAAWDHFELRWRHRDGHPVWMTGAGVPMRDTRGRVFGYRGTRRLLEGSDSASEVIDEARRRVMDLLSQGGVRVALQPIVDVQSGQLVGAEALARFDDGRGPRLWFDDAATAGLTRQLDELTFFTAVRALRSLPPPAYVSVNASPALILDAAFRQRLLRSRIDLTRLVVELTEHDRVEDYGALNAVLAQLRQHGVRCAIDDTGAGYSSLNHVLQLRPDIIKLDRDLIADLESDRARRALVTALVLVALETGSALVGEGVETPAQLELLATLGVDQAQGYVLAHPSVNPGVWSGWPGRHWLREVDARG